MCCNYLVPTGETEGNYRFALCLFSVTLVFMIRIFDLISYIKVYLLCLVVHGSIKFLFPAT